MQSTFIYVKLVSVILYSFLPLWRSSVHSIMCVTGSYEFTCVLIGNLRMSVISVVSGEKYAVLHVGNLFSEIPKHNTITVRP